MKKIIIIVGILSLFHIFKSINSSVIIPSDAIRFRVIANSNSEEDQLIKQKVKSNLERELITKMEGVESLSTAKDIINSSLDDFDNIVSKTLKDNNASNKYFINYGYNYFPEKTYKGVTYKEGNYESLVITLGQGLGENWWCVLFPPLCLIDASNYDETSEVEYKFYIKDLIDKYF